MRINSLHQQAFMTVENCGRNSLESSGRMLLGGLLHRPSDATTLRLYICPHWSSGSSQLVKFEVQVEK